MSEVATLEVLPIELQENKVWDWWANHDPLWAILTDPSKRGGRWDISEFFRTGETEIAAVIHYMQLQGLEIKRNEPILDFGCGVGRLARALSKHFDSVTGVDTSAGMITQARAFNGDINNINFELLGPNGLRPYADNSFGFIYSSLVLQHLPPEISANFMKELMRVLKPGGVFIFQVADHFKPIRHHTLAEQVEDFRKSFKIRTRVKELLETFGFSPADKVPEIKMYGLEEESIRGLFKEVGGNIINVKVTNSSAKDFNGNLRFLATEPQEGWVSKQYCVVKQENE